MPTRSKFRREIARLASRLAEDESVANPVELLGEALVVTLAVRREILGTIEAADPASAAAELRERLPDVLAWPGTSETPPSEVLAALCDELDDLVTTEADIDYLGEFHQATLSGEWRVESGESRRATGAFYTPRHLTRYVVDRTLGRRLYGTRDGRPDGERLAGREPFPPERATELTILDPAAGTGAFLREAHRKLCDFYERAGTPAGDDRAAAEIAVGQLYGIDRDARATDFARLNLAFDVAARGGELSAAGPPLASHLVTANALLFERWPDEGSDEAADLAFADGRPCQWRRDFPEVFADGGFNVVLGNPPWVSYGLRDTGGLEAAEKTYVRERFDAAQYKLPLYPLFMELALRLARPGGVTGLVVPDSFLVGSRFSNVRELLVEEHGLEMVSLFPDGLWADGTSGRTVIYRVVRDGADTDEVAVRTVGGEPGDEKAERRVARDRLSAAPGYRIEVFADEAVDRLVDRMRGVETRVGDIVELYSGCIAWFGQASIVSETPRAEHVIRDRADEVVVTDEAAESRWRPLVSSGREIEPYGPAVADKYIYVHADPAVRRRYIKSGHDLARYTPPKLLMRQTGDAPVVAWEDEGAFCLNNLHVVDPREGVGPAQLRALLGLLNSTPMRVFYQAVTMERGRALAQTDIETIERLPVPAPERAAEALDGPVDRILAGEVEADEAGIDERGRELYGISDRLMEEVREGVR